MVLKVLNVFGTRPEAIKMAPIILRMKDYPERIHSVVCATAQHREMSDQIMNLFGITPDYDLDVMQHNQTPLQVLSKIIDRLDAIVISEKPDWILAQGDTTTVLATSLVAFHNKVKFGHVEAGLRTWDKHHPFPEEINRQIADLLADAYFAPTSVAKNNLLRENVAEERIFVTGNTVIDALLNAVNLPYDWNSSDLAILPDDKDIMLVTTHRRENFGEPLKRICSAVKQIAEKYHNSLHIAYSVHHNPNVKGYVTDVFSGIDNVTLFEPLDYIDMVQLMKRSSIILTDSGGIQEEAPSLGVPVLVLRETTERQESIEYGTAKLVGSDIETIVSEVVRVRSSADKLAKDNERKNPYGDGRAAQKIVDILLADNIV